MKTPAEWSRHSWRKQPIALGAEEWTAYLDSKLACAGYLRLAFAAAARAGIRLKVNVAWPNVTGPGDPDRDVRVMDEERSTKRARR